jgi:hypothetical protein
MLIRLTVAALGVLLFAGTLAAQNYAGHPEHRIRFVKPDNAPPNELYTENRVIVTNSSLNLVGSGMQVTGQVVTDFEADSVPAGVDAPTGQLREVQVSIELYYHDNVIIRDRDGKPVETRIETRDLGRLVPGQSMVVTTNREFGRFSIADFALPAMNKPLAPGLYRLAAVVRFRSQSERVQRAIKYCSDWYGVRVEQTTDPDTQEVFSEMIPIMSNADIHEEVYKTLLDRPGNVNSTTLMWVGEVLKDGNAKMISPQEGTARAPANYVVWSYHIEMVGQLLKYEHELDNADAVVDAELEMKLKAEPRRNATPEDIAKLEALKDEWRKQAEAEKVRIKRDNRILIDTYGGRTTRDEARMHTAAVAAKAAVVEQVSRYHEYLQLRYWVLTDGLLQYSGWNQFNVPGYNAWAAFEFDDIAKSTRDREERLARLEAQPGGLDGVLERRRENWKFQPPEVRTPGLAYLSDYDQSSKWDSNKFVKKPASGLEFDVSAWSTYRADTLVKFIEATDKAFNQVTTTSVYAVQTWPQALTMARAARDDVIVAAYAWEFYILTDKQKLEREKVIEMWNKEPDLGELKIADYLAKATVAPGTIKSRFDSGINMIKSEVKVTDFSFTYSQAIQRGVEARALPGARPPSAPTKD